MTYQIEPRAAREISAGCECGDLTATALPPSPKGECNAVIKLELGNDRQCAWGTVRSGSICVCGDRDLLSHKLARRAVVNPCPDQGNAQEARGSLNDNVSFDGLVASVRGFSPNVGSTDLNRTNQRYLVCLVISDKDWFAPERNFGCDQLNSDTLGSHCFDIDDVSVFDVAVPERLANKVRSLSAKPMRGHCGVCCIHSSAPNCGNGAEAAQPKIEIHPVLSCVVDRVVERDGLTHRHAQHDACVAMNNQGFDCDATEPRAARVNAASHLSCLPQTPPSARLSSLGDHSGAFWAASRKGRIRGFLGDLVGGISLFAFGYLLLWLPLLFG